MRTSQAESSRLSYVATQSILSQAQAQYSVELSKKQALIDRQNAELRDIAQQQKEELERIKTLQRHRKERDERRKKIRNLRQAYEEMQAEEQEANNAPPRLEGEDAEVVSLRIHSDKLNTGSDAEKEEYLRSLPSVPRLRALITAYTESNKSLEARLMALRDCSSERESQYRKVVALCTGMPEDQVDNMLEGLIAAVESEGAEKVDMARVREFLRKVEGAEA